MKKTTLMGKDKDIGINNKDDHHRDEAYTLDDPSKHRAYYDAWAKTYDDDFLKAEGYTAPQHVARMLAAMATPTDSPVADIGCGTGAIGTSLAALNHDMLMDGFDISAGMLDMAHKTGHYRATYQVDFTHDVPHEYGGYGAIVSSGTFTLGHLGPDDLLRALALGRKDTLVLISINTIHFDDKGFMGAFQDWQSRGMITSPDFHEISLYKDKDAASTDNVSGRIAAFRLINL